ncbi:MAG: hypothetical protein ACRCRR_05360 [Rickettsia sp.]
MIYDSRYGNDPSLGPVNGAIPATSGTLTITDTSTTVDGKIIISTNQRVTLESLGHAEELILEPHSSVKVTDLNNYVVTNPSDQNKTIVLSGETTTFDDQDNLHT